MWYKTNTMGYFIDRGARPLLSFFQIIGEITISIGLILARIGKVLSTLLVELCVIIGTVVVGIIPVIVSIIRFFWSIVIGVIASTTRVARSLRLPTLKRKATGRLEKPKPREKIKPKRIRTITPILSAFIVGFILAVFAIGIPVGYFILSKEIPNPKILTMRDIPVTSKIFDRNGELLYEIYADQNRTPIPLSDIPANFKNATLAIEDKSFYQHNGYSVSGIIRALYSIIVNRERQGGSTITQQLVRSALLTPEPTIYRKLKELALSVWTEQIYTKDQILEMYFNQVPYGGTAWGVEAAAQLYFGKDIKEVTLAEAALLAGLPAAPSKYSPFGAQPELALNRQKEVLRRMEEDGYISHDERLKGEEETLSFHKPAISIRAPHFVMYVKELLSREFGERMVAQGGLRVTTTLDLSLQEKVQQIITNQIAQLSSLNVGNGAAVVADPKSGEILAMVGSKDYFDINNEGNVNVALTPQQPGSTIKVVNYSAALQNGFTAATLINDSPITFNSAGSPPYAPVNYDGKFHGYVTLRNALGNSYNIPAVRTLAKIGVPTMITQGKAMGIESWDNAQNFGLSLTLGGGEVTMLDMARVYATLADGGITHELTPFISVTDYLGKSLLPDQTSTPQRSVPESIAYIISDILSDNGARTASFGPNSQLNIPGQWVVVKTGTSNDKRDNWAIGYTRDFVVTVWVGNNDNRPMNQTLTSGITGATPIWRQITDELLKSHPSTKPEPPEGIITKNCRGREELFIAGTEQNACQPIPTPSPTPETK